MLEKHFHTINLKNAKLLHKFLDCVKSVASVNSVEMPLNWIFSWLHKQRTFLCRVSIRILDVF